MELLRAEDTNVRKIILISILSVDILPRWGNCLNSRSNSRWPLPLHSFQLSLNKKVWSSITTKHIVLDNAVSKEPWRTIMDGQMGMLFLAESEATLWFIKLTDSKHGCSLSLEGTGEQKGMSLGMGTSRRGVFCSLRGFTQCWELKAGKETGTRLWRAWKGGLRSMKTTRSCHLVQGMSELK